MFHLVHDTIEPIENNLMKVAQFRNSFISFWMGIICMCIVVGVFGLFLYMSYNPQKNVVEAQRGNIEFNPLIWNNAVRNVPATNYGQTPQVETGYNIQGFSSGRSASAF